MTTFIEKLKQLDNEEFEAIGFLVVIIFVPPILGWVPWWGGFAFLVFLMIIAACPALLVGAFLLLLYCGLIS